MVGREKPQDAPGIARLAYQAFKDFNRRFKGREESSQSVRLTSICPNAKCALALSWRAATYSG